MKKNIILLILICILVISGCKPIQTEEKIATIGIARWGANPEFTRNVQGF